ncbi:hypothetical protein SAMN05421665_3532 [Yoonia rosea]|uniref:Uncharacterized protein n=1 Tax=Yoonia rosea TaxID=287098 RepID=A0A1R3XK19_9RHOB|nr:hypothetical protein SAMN05421665_3532 [Yoonia rosea]
MICPRRKGRPQGRLFAFCETRLNVGKNGRCYEVIAATCEASRKAYFSAPKNARKPTSSTFLIAFFSGTHLRLRRPASG